MSKAATFLAYLSLLILEFFMLLGVAGFLMMAVRTPSVHKDIKIAYYSGGAVTFLIFLIFNLILFCRWRQFKIAIAVVDASADYLAATKRIAMVSVFYFLVSLAFTAFCVISGGYMLTMYGTTMDPHFAFQFRDPVIKKDNAIYLAVLLFGFLWCLAFIQNKTNFICMVSASTFYFSSSRELAGTSSVS